MFFEFLQDPFTVNPPLAGRGRWTKTFEYFFEATNPYASDLSITFAWNLNLTTYDGTPDIL